MRWIPCYEIYDAFYWSSGSQVEVKALVEVVMEANNGESDTIDGCL